MNFPALQSRTSPGFLRISVFLPCFVWIPEKPPGANSAVRFRFRQRKASFCRNTVPNPASPAVPASVSRSRSRDPEVLLPRRQELVLPPQAAVRSHRKPADSSHSFKNCGRESVCSPAGNDGQDFPDLEVPSPFDRLASCIGFCRSVFPQRKDDFSLSDRRSEQISCSLFSAAAATKSGKFRPCPSHSFFGEVRICSKQFECGSALFPFHPARNGDGRRPDHHPDRIRSRVLFRSGAQRIGQCGISAHLPSLVLPRFPFRLPFRTVLSIIT